MKVYQLSSGFMYCKVNTSGSDEGAASSAAGSNAGNTKEMVLQVVRSIGDCSAQESYG